MADATLTEKPKLISPVTGETHIMSPLIQCPEHNNTTLFLAFLSKTHKLNQLVINEYQIKLKLKSILQNN